MRFKGVWLLGWADHATHDTSPADNRIGSSGVPHREHGLPDGRGADPRQTGWAGGVVGLEFNLMQRTLTVQHELPSLSPVEQALKAIGMQAVRMDEASAGQTTKLSIAKMDCPTEEALIRNKLGTVAGVLVSIST
jgi:hypothetical protein